MTGFKKFRSQLGNGLKFGAIALILAGCASGDGPSGGGPSGDGPSGHSLSDSSRGRAVPKPKRTGTAPVDTLLRVAKTTRSSGNLASAADLYRRAHNLDRQRTEPLFELGITLNAARAHQDAAAAFRAVLEIDPGHGQALWELANTLLALNRPQLAYKTFEALSQQGKKKVAALNGMGVALDRAGTHRAAQVHYREALKLGPSQLDPSQLSVRNNLGLSLALSGDKEGAIALLKEVATDAKATPRERQNLALAYGLAGDFKEAAKVSRIDLGEPAVQNNLAYYQYLQTLSGAAKANAAMTGQTEPAP